MFLMCLESKCYLPSFNGSLVTTVELKGKQISHSHYVFNLQSAKLLNEGLMSPIYVIKSCEFVMAFDGKSTSWFGRRKMRTDTCTNRLHGASLLEQGRWARNVHKMKCTFLWDTGNFHPTYFSMWFIFIKVQRTVTFEPLRCDIVCDQWRMQYCKVNIWKISVPHWSTSFRFCWKLWNCVTFTEVDLFLVCSLFRI
jgi:hypothetical protein